MSQPIAVALISWMLTLWVSEAQIRDLCLVLDCGTAALLGRRPAERENSRIR